MRKVRLYAWFLYFFIPLDILFIILLIVNGNDDNNSIIGLISIIFLFILIHAVRKLNLRLINFYIAYIIDAMINLLYIKIY